MAVLLSLLKVEAMKIRRSAAVHVLWLLPLVFLVMDYRAYGRVVVATEDPTPLQIAFFPFVPLKSLAILWAGLLHPLLTALLPPLLLQGEHKFDMWKHLHCQPVSRRTQFFAKAMALLLLNGTALALVAIGLRIEWGLIATLHLKNPFVFQWIAVAKTLGWMFLGSMPLLFFYLWLADRISTGAISMVFGLIGMMLTIALAGQEMYPLWQRDVIPWVLPYTCTQRSIQNLEARQEVHIVAAPYQKRPDQPFNPKVDESKLRVRLKIITDLPYDELGLKPPPPTPTWMLVAFSLAGGLGLLGVGLLDAGRNRA